MYIGKIVRVHVNVSKFSFHEIVNDGRQIFTDHFLRDIITTKDNMMLVCPTGNCNKKVLELIILHP